MMVATGLSMSEVRKYAQTQIKGSDIKLFYLL